MSVARLTVWVKRGMGILPMHGHLAHESRAGRPCHALATAVSRLNAFLVVCKGSKGLATATLFRGWSDSSDE